MVTSDLIGTKISCMMMSGEKRQGKLISMNEVDDEFVISWKRRKEDDHFFMTTLRLSRVESLTKYINPEQNGSAQAESTAATT